MISNISLPSKNVDQLLDARVVQTDKVLRNAFVDIADGINTDSDESVDGWDNLINSQRDVAFAQFARNQNFIIQHHLAKTILSAT